MTIEEVKQRAKECAESSVRVLKEIRRQNYHDQWSEPFALLVREQKVALKQFLNWIRLDPDKFNCPDDLLRPQYLEGTEPIGAAIAAEVDAIFVPYERSRGN
jgi:hypothetical protein